MLSETERDIVAHHEMGHALVAFSLPHADPVHKVTIIPRGVAALGMTYQLPTEDRYLLRRSELDDRIAVLVGGHVAEELVYGELSTGAHNDLERATALARAMVMRYGMSERLGPLTFGGSGGPGLPAATAGPAGTAASGSTARRRPAPSTRRSGASSRRRTTGCGGSSGAKKSTLLHAAQVLKRRETLEGEELRRLLAGEPVPVGA